MNGKARKVGGTEDAGSRTATGTAGRCLPCGGPWKRPFGILCSPRAFSLPELMVTLVVSSLLVTGIVTGYLVQKRSYEDEAALIDMQLNGRLAMNRVTEIVRNAGLGCRENFPPGDNQILQGAFSNYTRVFTVDDRDDGPDGLTVVTGLRALTRVESLGADHVVLAGITNPNGVPFFDLDKNRYIFFSPRSASRYLEVLGVDEGTRQVQLSSPCTDPAGEACGIQVGYNVYRVNAYTITLDQNGTEIIDVDGDGSVADGDDDGVPDPYIYNNTRDLIADGDSAAAGQANVSSYEVAEGIEALQFRFGWDADGDGEIIDSEFVDDPTGNEHRIRAVRVYLLARTRLPDPGYEDPNTQYTLANHTIHLDSDERQYRRQLFVETVMVRNMNL
jgi:prepilin-type N-terminal cleavage/methylation domain-containing protein